MAFTLHPQLAKDCALVCDLKFCRVLLMNNAHFPWLILVPMQDGARELFDLSEEDYLTVMEEVRECSKRFTVFTKAHKMNVAALGNMVPQLHIHIIARFEKDAAWPAPVWNSALPPQPYAPTSLAEKVEEIRRVLREKSS